MKDEQKHPRFCWRIPIHTAFSSFILHPYANMPTYDYKCQACGHEFEKFQSITSSPIKKCPHCGKNQVKRLIGAGAGLIFKGSGFYVTDYRDKAYTDRAKSESSGGSDTKATSTVDSTPKTGSDATSAAKSVPAEAKSAPSGQGKTPSSNGKAKGKAASKAR